jgi:hypothetical protein
MTNRIIIGQRNSLYGLWVSKPGANVVSAPESDLLFSMSGGMLQVFQKGSFTIPVGGNANISLPGSSSVGDPICFVWVKEPREVENFYSLNNMTINVRLAMGPTSGLLQVNYRYPTDQTIDGNYIIATEI